MKILALLVLGIISAAAAAAIEEEESTQRDKRVFSLFSIVQFPNEECATTDINVKAGVCTTTKHQAHCSTTLHTASGVYFFHPPLPTFWRKSRLGRRHLSTFNII